MTIYYSSPSDQPLTNKTKLSQNTSLRLSNSLQYTNFSHKHRVVSQDRHCNLPWEATVKERPPVLKDYAFLAERSLFQFKWACHRSKSITTGRPHLSLVWPLRWSFKISSTVSLNTDSQSTQYALCSSACSLCRVARPVPAWPPVLTDSRSCHPCSRLGPWTRQSGHSFQNKIYRNDPSSLMTLTLKRYSAGVVYIQ